MCNHCCSPLQSSNVYLAGLCNILMIRTVSSPLFHLVSVRQRKYSSFLCFKMNLRVAALTTKLVNILTRLEGLYRSFVQGSDELV